MSRCIIALRFIPLHDVSVTETAGSSRQKHYDSADPERRWQSNAQSQIEIEKRIETVSKPLRPTAVFDKMRLLEKYLSDVMCCV